MLVQFVEDVRHFGGLRAAGKRTREEPHAREKRRKKNESDGRKVSPFVRLDKDVRLADRRPALQKKRNQREAGFVDEGDEPAVFTGFFLSAAIWTAAIFQPLGRNIFSTA
jgi:hypothetical protein